VPSAAFPGRRPTLENIVLTLYFSPGACSMASHIGLEEAGAAYEERPVRTSHGEQHAPEYLKVNPRGKVPALVIDGQVLTENTAILVYIARRFPSARLLPEHPMDEARCIATLAWFSSAVHPPFTRCMRAERFADSEAAQASVREMGRQSFWMHLQEIDGMLQDRQWIMGDQYTVADPYALVFYGWGLRIRLPMAELAAYTNWKDRMVLRPAVHRVLNRENSIILQSMPG